MIKKNLLYSVFFIFGCCNGTPDPVDIVIFSYNRPMQLYALCESLERHVTGLGEVHVIYRVSNDAYQAGYQLVQDRFKSYHFHQQDFNPYPCFKPLVMRCAFETPNKFIMFAVDDNIVKDAVDLQACTEALKKTGAYAFFLRLGKNITQSFMRKMDTPVPVCKTIGNGIFSYCFKDSTKNSEWYYAHNVDMTIYKKDDIRPAYTAMPMTTPWYETAWAAMVDLTKQGLFFEESKIINITVNLVETKGRNLAQFTESWKKKMDAFSTSSLLEVFNKGKKIDISQFYRYKNNAPHVEFEYKFITR